MPSGPKKRRAAKRKKEGLDKILASRVATISKDAIDNSNSSKDANLGDHPVVATSTVVDSPEPEDKSVNDEIKPISDVLNVLPSVDTKKTSPVLDLNGEECFARTENISCEGIPQEEAPCFVSPTYKQDYLVVNDDNPTTYQAAEGENCSKEFVGDLISKQDSANVNVFSKNPSEDAVHDVDAPVDILHKSVQEGNEDNYLETNDDAPLSSPTTVISKSDEGSPVQEKGDATLTDHMASESRENRLLQSDGALQDSQNPPAGMLSADKEIAVEDKNVGHDRKTLAVLEQQDFLKNTIEELLDATNKLREVLIKFLHSLDAIELMEVA